MAMLKISVERLARIKKRQGLDRWSGDYVAAIFATHKEAPSNSRPSILVPKKLGYRDMHLLSHPEKFAALLSLYHPNVWEIHEQKVLSAIPRPHFLLGHPYATGINWPSLKGTIDVVSRMDRLAKHPKVKFLNQRNGEWEWAPFPYIGDLLLFMRDEVGVYCVNWTVKDKYINFRKRGPNSKKKPSIEEFDHESELRHELEANYYLDANIRTVQVAGEAIDKDVVANLEELFLHHGRRLVIDVKLKTEIVECFKDVVGTQIPCFEFIFKLKDRFGVSVDVLQLVLRQSIWNRDVKVDLYQPILMDQPLRHETRDVLNEYSSWFVR